MKVICDHSSPRLRRCSVCDHAVPHEVRTTWDAWCMATIRCEMARPYIPKVRCVRVKERK